MYGPSAAFYHMTVVFLNFCDGVNPNRSVRFSSRTVNVFPALSLHKYGPHPGIFFHMVLQRIWELPLCETRARYAILVGRYPIPEAQDTILLAVYDALPFSTMVIEHHLVSWIRFLSFSIFLSLFNNSTYSFSLTTFGLKVSKLSVKTSVDGWFVMYEMRSSHTHLNRI